MTEKLSVRINNIEHNIVIEARTLLCDLLREKLNLTGTHIGCSYGVCGACTVIVDGEPVRSCLTLAIQTDGCSVITIEGLSDQESFLHLKKAFHEEHGLQCGFCTPGLICSLSVAITRDDMSSDQELDAVIDGHLCRCTGYVNIRRAAKKAAKNFQGDFHG